MKKFKWSYLYLGIVFLFLYAPIFYLIFYSFNEGGTMNSFTGFTWENYEAVFEDTRLIIIVLNTFMLAFLSALIATIIGTFGAMGIYYTKKRRARTALLSMNNILLVSPDVIIGASFLIFFTLLGFGLGFQSVLLSHIAFSIPIVVLMVLPKLQEMNDSMVDAARDLGANNFQVVKNIILPYLSPGIIAGYFMAFTGYIFRHRKWLYDALSRDLFSCKTRNQFRNQCAKCVSFLVLHDIGHWILLY